MKIDDGVYNGKAGCPHFIPAALGPHVFIFRQGLVLLAVVCLLFTATMIDALGELGLPATLHEHGLHGTDSPDLPLPLDTVTHAGGLTTQEGHHLRRMPRAWHRRGSRAAGSEAYGGLFAQHDGPSTSIDIRKGVRVPCISAAREGLHHGGCVHSLQGFLRENILPQPPSRLLYLT